MLKGSIIKETIVVFALTLTLPALALAAELKVNGQPVEDGAELTFYGDELSGKRINFELVAENLEKAEISFDGGKTWEEMKDRMGVITYRYKPYEDGTFTTELLLTYNDGTIETCRPGVTITYFKLRPDEAVIEVLEKIKDYYESKNQSKFMALIAPRYPERTEFEEGISQDFYNFRNIRMFYKVLRRTFDQDYQGAIWDVYWEKKYDNRSGDESSVTGTVTTRLEKSGGQWMVSAMRDNTIFGTTLIGEPDLAVTDIAYVSGAVTHNFSVQVHNYGTATVNSYLVTWYYPTATTLYGEETISADLNPNGTKVCEATILSVAVDEVVKVVVDRNNAKEDSNRGNNSTSYTITVV